MAASVTEGDPPRWEVLLSHHFPNRYGRTLSLAIRGRTIHFCARCSGQLFGGIVVVLLFVAGFQTGPGLFLPSTQLFFAFAPFAAALDWLTQSLGRRESDNGLRIISGFLLGAAFTDAILLLLTERWLLFAGALLIAVVYVVALAVVLKVTGGWRLVLQEHFPGVETGIEP